MAFLGFALVPPALCSLPRGNWRPLTKHPINERSLPLSTAPVNSSLFLRQLGSSPQFSICQTREASSRLPTTPSCFQQALLLSRPIFCRMSSLWKLLGLSADKEIHEEEKAEEIGENMRLLRSYYDYMGPRWKELTFEFTRTPAPNAQERDQWTCLASFVWVVAEGEEVVVSAQSLGPHYSKRESKEDAAGLLYHTGTMNRFWFEWGLFDYTRNTPFDPKYKTCWIP